MSATQEPQAAADPAPRAGHDPAPPPSPWTEPPRTKLGHTLHALSLLRERGWAGGLLLVIVLSIAFSFLAEWQFGRHENKLVRNEHIDANYGTQPLPLAQVLATPATPLRDDQQWTPVRVTGRYDPAGTRLIRNRPLDAVYGFEVVVPLRLADGSVLLVDRGWVPNGQTAAEPDTLPAPPAGEVAVVARLRPSEPPDPRQPPPGQEMHLDVPKIAKELGGNVYQAYGVLAEESPAPAQAPTLLPKPDEDLGPHLSYTVQWWMFAVAAFGVFGYYLSKEAWRRDGWAPHRDRLWDRLRSRRGEPTDEEWEDSADR